MKPTTTLPSFAEQSTSVTAGGVNDEAKVVGKIRDALQKLEYDVAMRNQSIERRDRAIWGTSYTMGTGSGLFEGLKFPDGHDVTDYNWGPRTVHIHASQLFGRGIKIRSSYNKEDESIAPSDQEKKLIQLRNKKAKANADARNKVIEGMIDDNGGQSLFYDGGTVGSAYGFTIYKDWFDKTAKKSRIQLIETVNNCYVGWSDTNFREADFYGFVYQISPDKASRDYGTKIPRNADGTLDLELSQFGKPFQYTDAYPTSTDALDKTNTAAQTQRPMASVIEFTGYLTGYKGQNGKIVPCKQGEETRFNALIVGNHLVQVITDESVLPDYEVIPNIKIPRRPWGQSDLSDAAISINQTYIQKMSDWLTMYNKFLFPHYAAKGYEPGTLPKFKQRQGTMFAQDVSQSLELVQSPLSTGYEMPRVLEELKEEYVRVAGISRVMFDDPSVSANSNQALMTTLKGVLDIAEAKQQNWSIALERIFKRAFDKAAKHIPELKDMASDDFNFSVVWPSILRKEDAAYQQILLNAINRGAISMESYQEQSGLVDSFSEEIDRIRDEMSDPVTAAALSNQLGLLATQLIAPATPQAPSVRKNINVNVTPDQNLDPQTNAMIVQEAMKDPAGVDAPAPTATPDQSNPMLTPDQNTGQTASQPGSGAPAVSPEGAIAQANQNAGA